MKTSKVEIEPNVLSIIPMESKIDKNKKFEFQMNLKEIMVICCALDSFSYVLRECLKKEKDKKLIRYINSYIKFQQNLIKDFNNEVYR